MEWEGTPRVPAKPGLVSRKMDEAEEGHLRPYVVGVSVADRSGKAISGRGLWPGRQET